MTAGTGAGAELHPDLAPLEFLLGTWEGAGVGGYPTIESFRFGQEISFSHNGKPFLAYTSRTWLLDEEGNPGRPLAAETGFWRPQPGNRVEVLLAHPTGITEIYLGEVTGTRIELATDVVARTSSAKEVTAGHRLYGLVGADLAYAYDMAAVGQPLQSHISAQLKHVRRAVALFAFACSEAGAGGSRGGWDIEPPSRPLMPPAPAGPRGQGGCARAAARGARCPGWSWRIGRRQACRGSHRGRGRSGTWGRDPYR